MCYGGGGPATKRHSCFTFVFGLSQIWNECKGKQTQSEATRLRLQTLIKSLVPKTGQGADMSRTRTEWFVIP